MHDMLKYYLEVYRMKYFFAVKKCTAWSCMGKKSIHNPQYLLGKAE